MRSAILIAGIVAGMLGASPAPGQVVSSPPVDVPDSAAARIVVVRVVQDLSWRIAAGVFATEERPWRITVPDSTVPVWRAVRSGLYTVLHGRPMASTDTESQYIRLSPIVVRGDSLLTSYTVGTMRRCRGKWTRSETRLDLIAIRDNGSWMVPVNGYTAIIDGLGC